ncbi:GNAT family N-acetyltransferase [Pseudoroseomonas wenyumeiae]|uniref:GNAT family N-acetyltransferase n=2 Tax=Teichococcus wenyumeiae TaxID=2478470 RepID=A0A3A9J674_9PROT|nr:GNAT family N-acetyltransferase [Pseudoroseomonas wenyumeiae]RKK01171.1 GNAT family N-acetyltransferase [Pseudoroseomonas wenyumeiae]RMI15125.1 GNAT family N-acetyltransferase [Pseudoroseomonas wenyumeiae]
MKRVQLRQLGLDEMDAAASVHRASFDERLPWLTGLHTPAEDRWFYRQRVFPECSVWGAIENDTLLGIIAFREDWIDQFYVLPSAQGKGIGTALLEVAKSKADSLLLWTFQRNNAARRFYEQRGFVAVRETDGSKNEEREPDVLYRWVTS